MISKVTDLIDRQGYRLGVGIILLSPGGNVLWARRHGQDAWQFPQGGMHEGETIEDAMYRELHEELGLHAVDVEIIAVTNNWLRYRLPKQLIRHYQKPVCIGQKQKWFLLKLVSSEQKVQLDATEKPEFDSWCWVDYWYPLEQIIKFKHKVYELALEEFKKFVDSS